MMWVWVTLVTHTWTKYPSRSPSPMLPTAPQRTARRIHPPGRHLSEAPGCADNMPCQHYTKPGTVHLCQINLSWPLAYLNVKCCHLLINRREVQSSLGMTFSQCRKRKVARHRYIQIEDCISQQPHSKRVLQPSTPNTILPHYKPTNIVLLEQSDHRVLCFVHRNMNQLTT